MSVAELIEKLRVLPKEKQEEVSDFVDYLVGKFGRSEQGSWTDSGFSELSLAQALRGMEDDPVAYSSDDIRNPWQ